MRYYCEIICTIFKTELRSAQIVTICWGEIVTISGNVTIRGHVTIRGVPIKT